jgi:hypothetical protein
LPNTLSYSSIDRSISETCCGKGGGGLNGDLRRFLCENDYVFYTRLTIDDIQIKKSFLRKLRKL